MSRCMTLAFILYVTNLPFGVDYARLATHDAAREGDER